ncbi:GD18374 [Drosophila simulans]|uniref:GD18374 n=1 Tax=Drosophila simulans TaxID=7240 RepID=B4R211_DROSI|nr:GD18374 [Drosophila simulans]
MKRKGRIDRTPKVEPPKPSRVVNTEAIPLNVEAKSQEIDDQAAPFILVDCANSADRSDLEAILSSIEKERMKRVQADIEQQCFPLLEDIEPPPELDMPINLSSQALVKLNEAESERRFKEDLETLSIAGLEWEKDTSITITSNLLSDMTIEDSKLLLRTMAGLRRQDTFEIEPKKNQKIRYPEVSTKSAVSERKPLPLTAKGGKCVKVISETDKIFSQIGDLLVKLQLQHEGSNVLKKGSSYSYMVNIKPTGSASNCSVYAITKLKSHEIKETHAENQRTSHAPFINILYRGNGGLVETSPLPTTTRCIEGSSIGPMSLRETPSSRIKPPFVRKRPCSYLRVPTPVKFCHGRKKN